MSKKKSNPKQMLLEQARSEGSEVVHYPYTAEFEAHVQQINPNATLEEKHRIYEEVLKAGGVVPPAAPKIDVPQIPQSPERVPESIATSPQPTYELPETQARRLIDPERNRLLFEREEPSTDSQPWSVQSEPKLLPEHEERRQRLLADLADSRFATTEQRITYILSKFPETRDSDIALSIRYWRIFQADVIERWRQVELEILFELDRIETIGRSRRMIQNDLRLFRGLEETLEARKAAQKEFYEYLAEHKASLPEVRFYLDETGGEGTYTGIAGICVLNWKQFDKHHAALQKWRVEQGWPETIHFSEISENKSDRGVSLLHQLQKRRSGVLFLGYSMITRGRTDRVQFTLFIQLVVDSLKYLRACGCLPENRVVRVVKEAQEGFDLIYLRELTKQLSEVVALEFPGELTVLPIETVPKGRTVMLECADLIAGGMQRRAQFKARNPKDRLAEAIMNVTGFEDHSDPGVLFKYFSPF